MVDSVQSSGVFRVSMLQFGAATVAATGTSTVFLLSTEKMLKNVSEIFLLAAPSGPWKT